MHHQPHQHPLPTEFDAFSHEFSLLIDVYATKQMLPMTVVAALDEISIVMNEIEMCQLEGHTPDHHDIAWRVGYLVFCMHLAECIGQRDDSVQSLVTQFLDQMGVSVACAIEIAVVRLRFLCCGEDIVHIDTSVLVPIMKRHLSLRP